MVADTFYWEAFSRFGSALQKQGVTVVRMTGAPADLPNKIQLGLQRLLFPRVTYVADWKSPDAPVADLLVAAHGSPAVAVEASDDLAAALTASPQGAGYRRTSGDVEEGWLYDKLAMTALVRSLGLGVPRTWSDLGDAGDGRWVVVKRKLGFGGLGVRIVEARPSAILQASRDLAGAAEDVFLQELVPGGTLHVGGVALDGRVLVAAAYSSRSALAGGLGPASSITIIDDAGLLSDSATIIGALGYTGAFSLDFVRDQAGGNLFIDFNSRVFGSWLGLQRAGLDFLGAYRFAYGLAPGYEERPATLGRSVAVQWTRAVGEPEVPLVSTYVASLAQSLADSRVLGGRWLVVAMAETSGAAALRISRTLRRVAWPARGPSSGRRRDGSRR